MDKELQLRMAVSSLQDSYVSTLDSGKLEQWPEFFTEDCHYEIIPKENADLDLPAPLIYCTNRRMLRDRVVSLREANIYEEHTYRHLTSGFVLTSQTEDVVRTTSNYVVVITGRAGDSSLYQAGMYEDEVVRIDGRWLYRRKRVIYDTSRIPTLLATPI